MKFRIQAPLCLAIYDFEARIMLSLCLTFQGIRLPVWEKFNSNVAAKWECINGHTSFEFQTRNYMVPNFLWFSDLL